MILSQRLLAAVYFSNADLEQGRFCEFDLATIQYHTDHKPVAVSGRLYSVGSENQVGVGFFFFGDKILSYFFFSLIC